MRLCVSCYMVETHNNPAICDSCRIVDAMPVSDLNMLLRVDIIRNGQDMKSAPMLIPHDSDWKIDNAGTIFNLYQANATKYGVRITRII